ncbi:hypothetical protein ACVDG2_04645 [Pseudosulfitobacter sp. RP-4]|nr:hypothetical protein [Pseudosulfitobacter pseudonitzschiae]
MTKWLARNGHRVNGQANWAYHGNGIRDFPTITLCMRATGDTKGRKL